MLNCPGAVGMARDEGPDTAVTEIYIPLLPRRYLDRNYTIVGRVISGMDTVNRLARVAPVDRRRPTILFGDDPVAAADAASGPRPQARPEQDHRGPCRRRYAGRRPPRLRSDEDARAPNGCPEREQDRLFFGQRLCQTPPKVLDICTLPVPSRPIIEHN
jgi:peptidylprolyl isomerase